MLTRGQALESIGLGLLGLSDDELRGVAMLVQKLKAGSEKYGPLDLKTDTRDFRNERRAESLDWLWYALFDDMVRPSPPGSEVSR